MTMDAVKQDDAGSVAATPESSNKRKRQPRNSACQNCASLKMKCISTEQGKCERCLRMDRECQPAIPKPRKRRTESALGGHEPGEMSMLSLAGSSATADPPPKFDIPRGDRDDMAERRSLLTRHDLSHTDSKSFVSLFSHGLGNIAACEELLRGVDYNFVANCFTIFRQLTRHFPFVELSSGADVISHVASRPVLTLAICTVSAASNPELQSRLSQAFRYTLSAKVIIGGERSIDLLTGLMIYLAWHHQYFSSPSQIHSELYLLAAIAADLGLYQSLQQTLDPSMAIERDRAFLGCYYLSGSLSAVAFDKPSPFRWTNNLRTCAENVATSGNMHTDRSLIAILEMAHAVDDLEESLRQATADQNTNFVQLVEMQVKAAVQRLKALKREHPSLHGSLVYGAAINHFYQRLFRVSESPEYAALIQCAFTAKEYVDDLLARPPATLHQVSIIDWTSLLEVLVMIAQVIKSTPSTGGGWEAGALTSMLQPETALQSLQTRMASAPANDVLSPRHEPLLRLFGRVCDGIRDRILQEGSSQDIGYLSTGGVLDTNFWNNFTAP